MISGKTVQVLLKYAPHWGQVHKRDPLLITNLDGLSSVALAIRHGNIPIAEMILDAAGLLDPQDMEILLHLAVERLVTVSLCFQL